MAACMVQRDCPSPPSPPPQGLVGPQLEAGQAPLTEGAPDFLPNKPEQPQRAPTTPPVNWSGQLASASGPGKAQRMPGGGSHGRGSRVLPAGAGPAGPSPPPVVLWLSADGGIVGLPPSTEWGLDGRALCRLRGRRLALQDALVVSVGRLLGQQDQVGQAVQLGGLVESLEQQEHGHQAQQQVHCRE